MLLKEQMRPYPTAHLFIRSSRAMPGNPKSIPLVAIDEQTVKKRKGQGNQTQAAEHHRTIIELYHMTLLFIEGSGKTGTPGFINERYVWAAMWTGADA